MNGTLVKKLGEYFLYMPYDSIYGPERTSAYSFFKTTMSTDTENVLVATTSQEDEYIELAKLSLESCNEVAGVYDLESLAENWVFTLNGHKWSNNDDTAGDNYGSFMAGAKAILELMSYKQFSEQQMREAIRMARRCNSDNGEFDIDAVYPYSDDFKNIKQKFTDYEIIQSLKQNEWDVEIEWEEEIGGTPTPYQKRTIIRELDNGEKIEWTCFWDNGWWGTDGVRCPNVISWQRMPILDRKNRLILNRL
jgi:hypothetical protein